MEESALIEAARTDPRHFAALYERYLGPIYRYCYVRLDSHELAEDATSEVFLKALTNLPNYRNGMFAAWLFRIAQNVVTDAYRKAYRAQTYIETAQLGLVSDGDLAADYIQREALTNALAVLTEEQRVVLELQLAGCTTAQIADALGKTQAAIKMLRFRALERIRAQLPQPA
jgi:RNA polymerase sigma-70 factor (ECF subfamily)